MIYKVALIGYGYWGPKLARNFLNSNNFEITNFNIDSIKMLTLFIKILFTIFMCLMPLSKILAEDKIRIGLVVPLSGEYSTIGDSIIKSTRLALNKINDEKFEIVPGDTKANPIDALKASKALYDQGIKIIIGPVFNEITKYLD